MNTKKYYWLKLKDSFFGEKIVKYLRKLPDGSTLTIIYLKLLCISLKTEGMIHYDKLFPCIEEEIALVIDEEVTLVKLTIRALIQAGVVEELDNDTLFLSAIQEMIGKESPSTERVRRHREKQKMLHCNKDVTESNNNEILCNTEIELENREEIKKDLDVELEIGIEKTKQILSLFQKYCKSYNMVSTPTSTHQKAIAESFQMGMTWKDYEIAFQKAENSSFLKGENKDKWKAKFGWMIQYNNLKKILSGNYDEDLRVSKPKGTFHDFPQRNYDYDSLEKQLLQKSTNQSNESKA